MLFYLLHIFSIKRTDFTQILCGLQEGGRSVFFCGKYNTEPGDIVTIIISDMTNVIGN